MDSLNGFSDLDKSYSNERVSTGISRLDALIGGGFPDKSIILVSGTSGSGKTILCYHFIDEGIKNDENCLFISSESHKEITLKQSDIMGFDFQSAITRGALNFLEVDMDKADILKDIETEIRSGGYDRVVLDSLTPVSEDPVHVRGSYEIIPSKNGSSIKRYPPNSVSATRMHVRKIVEMLTEEGCTSILTSEIPEGSRALSRDTVSEFLVDGIIMLGLDSAMDRRKLTIRKMRSTKHSLKPQDISITSKGIEFM
ncbi:MAG: ATPase domain-containing protein [Candidatus Thermoplasmatota archaeon]